MAVTNSMHVLIVIAWEKPERPEKQIAAAARKICKKSPENAEVVDLKGETVYYTIVADGYVDKKQVMQAIGEPNITYI